jgi:hypothetical protein
LQALTAMPVNSAANLFKVGSAVFMRPAAEGKRAGKSFKNKSAAACAGSRLMTSLSASEPGLN